MDKTAAERKAQAGKKVWSLSGNSKWELDTNFTDSRNISKGVFCSRLPGPSWL
jgi:hypothetical protein